MSRSTTRRAGVAALLLTLGLSACGMPIAEAPATSGDSATAVAAFVPACPPAPAGYARCLALIQAPQAQPLSKSHTSHKTTKKKSKTSPTPRPASKPSSTPTASPSPKPSPTPKESPTPGPTATPTPTPAPTSVPAVQPPPMPATDPAPQIPGLHPFQLHAAYSLPAAGGSGETIAVVDAMDDPNAEADLAVYRSTFGLPACTTANGCFRKIDGSGGTSYPPADAGWSDEISVDLDMVSAACPQCHILLVEAASADLPVLGAAEDTAARSGVVAITNSWGVPEQAAEVGWDVHFNHPGIAIVAASGDSGYGTVYPATSQYVTAVGGTTLTQASNSRGWTETAWSGGGSGCSAYEPKPAWQHDSGCSTRTTADVAAVADPSTGVAVYNTYQSNGWLVAGGTSAAAPIIAGVYVLAGNPTSAGPGYSYAHSGSLYDITSGSNSILCFGSYLCTAGPGYDGPTGLGTPHGTGAF